MSSHLWDMSDWIFLSFEMQHSKTELITSLPCLIAFHPTFNPICFIPINLTICFSLVSKTENLGFYCNVFFSTPKSVQLADANNSSITMYSKIAVFPFCLSGLLLAHTPIILIGLRNLFLHLSNT